MNPLVKKEIRLLLPGCLAVLALEVLLPWFFEDPDAALGGMCLAFFLGMIILSVDSFGREFSLGTFQSLMSQPVERRQIWRTKITVLVIASVLIFAAYFVSGWLWVRFGIDQSAFPWRVNRSDFMHAMTASGAGLFVAVAGGLWTALLLRQIAAAFWITFLVPFGILVITTLILPAKLADNDNFLIPLFYSMAGIYAVAGFWLARRLFFRAQDAAWTGGVINFSSWRYFESGVQSTFSLRRHRPFAALLKKEFQLHSISLFCAGALLALHIGVFFMRIFYARFHKNSIADVISDFFWVLWLIMPLIIGCTAVAEERKLGVMDVQFCQPVSRRLQFFIKFAIVMIFGTLLGGFMPVWLESIAAHLGAYNEIFTETTHTSNLFGSGLLAFKIGIVAVSVGFAVAAWFATTLARNFLQALSIAVVTCIGFCLFSSFLGFVNQHQITIFGFTPWHSILPLLMAVPTIPVVLLWLAWLNFNHFQESRRVWRSNLIGIAGALVFVVGASAIIYNRAWEIFEPAEPPHGAAKFSAADSPKLLPSSNYGNLLVRFPDGRIWYDNLSSLSFADNSDPWRELVFYLFRPLPKSAGPEQFIGGSSSSNWISASAERVEFPFAKGYRDTVGIKNDGTLWISEKAEPRVWTGANMVRYGDGTDWKQVVRTWGGLLLLKNNGTLWYWGSRTNHLSWSRTNWPTIRIFQPRQIGTSADWVEISPLAWIRSARRADGTVWQFDPAAKYATNELSRATNWDAANLQTFSQGNLASAFVGHDGTLWIRNGQWNKDVWQDEGYLQIGNETNWLAVSAGPDSIIALKSGGTLWKWNFPNNYPRDATKIPPSRLGVHNDWIGLTSAWGGSVSLAADGSLWLWPTGEYFDGALLKLPKQPEFLGNILGKSD